MLELRLLKANS